jgi:hypothetical protein
MIDTFDEYAKVYNRPSYMSVRHAIMNYMKVPTGWSSWDRDDVTKAKARYYYHTRQPYFLNWLNKNKTPEKITVSEEQVDAEYEEACETYEAYEDTNMRVGDMVVANWNRGEMSLVGEVVQILLIAGNQACVKAMNGTLMTYNLTNLRSIPKSF